MYNKTPFCGWAAPKVLLCKLNYECPAVPSEKKCTKHFLKFVHACTQKDPDMRPDVSQLLDMPFFKQAKGASYLENIIIKNPKYDPSKTETSGINWLI
jgi:serine/threonine protein kinase